MEFDILANKIHNERISNIQKGWKERELLGDNIYLSYCIWCNGYATREDKKNAKKFATWLKSEGIQLTQAQRNHIAKTYFGFSKKAVSL